MRIWGIGVVALTAAAALLGGRESAAEKTSEPASSPPRLVSGMLKSVESKPNMPSARCGYHYELLVASREGPVLIMIYDRKAPLDRLDDLVDREVEIQLNGGNVARSIRPLGANFPADAALADLSPTRHC